MCQGTCSSAFATIVAMSKRATTNLVTCHEDEEQEQEQEKLPLTTETNFVTEKAK